MARKNAFTESVDKLIGMKIHELRISMGWSRQQLATKIGVTHQQLQKYEKGTNRISAGRLKSIADALRKPVSFFFDEGDEPVGETIRDRLCIELQREFKKIKKPIEQNYIVNLTRLFARA